MKKLFLLLSVCFLSMLLLVSCGDKNTNNNSNEKEDKSSYKTDVPVSDIANEYLSIINSSSLGELDENYLTLNVADSIDFSLCEEYKMYMDLIGSADQFGILKASSEENADKLLEQAKKYLEKFNSDFMAEYNPEEVPKIQNASTKKNGLYVTFIIHDDEIKSDLLDVFDSTLKK